MEVENVAMARARERTDVAQRLVEVAMELLARDGVLAGLNLREVADGAEVNRANIYHYFGSRRELLRAAIQSQFADFGTRVYERIRELPFVDRKMETFRLRDDMNASQLLALLAADGDTDLDPMPNFDNSISDLRRDVIDGYVHRDHDLEALQVAFSSLSHGYRIFRDAYAARVGVPADELDGRVAAIVRAWLVPMSEAPRW